jgi:hypothetical protein
MKPQAGKTHKRPLMGPKRPIKQLNSKGKLPSIKNQIRGVQRLLAKVSHLPLPVHNCCNSMHTVAL